MAATISGAKIESLLLWAQKQTQDYPGVAVNDFTSSWRNGLAFCALLHRYRPELIDFHSLRADDVIYNNELAYSAAHREFGITPLLDAAEMLAADVPEQLNVITYVNLLYNYFKKLTPNSGSSVHAYKGNPTKTSKAIISDSTKKEMSSSVAKYQSSGAVLTTPSSDLLVPLSRRTSKKAPLPPMESKLKPLRPPPPHRIAIENVSRKKQLINIEQYPEDFNPFAEDLECDKDEQSDHNLNIIYPSELNPFGDEDAVAISEDGFIRDSGVRLSSRGVKKRLAPAPPSSSSVLISNMVSDTVNNVEKSSSEGNLSLLRTDQSSTATLSVNSRALSVEHVKSDFNSLALSSDSKADCLSETTSNGLQNNQFETASNDEVGPTSYCLQNTVTTENPFEAEINTEVVVISDVLQETVTTENPFEMEANTEVISDVLQKTVTSENPFEAATNTEVGGMSSGLQKTSTTENPFEAATNTEVGGMSNGLQKTLTTENPFEAASYTEVGGISRGPQNEVNSEIPLENVSNISITAKQAAVSGSRSSSAQSSPVLDRQHVSSHRLVKGPAPPQPTHGQRRKIMTDADAECSQREKLQMELDEVKKKQVDVELLSKDIHKKLYLTDQAISAQSHTEIAAASSAWPRTKRAGATQKVLSMLLCGACGSSRKLSSPPTSPRPCSPLSLDGENGQHLNQDEPELLAQWLNLVNEKNDLNMEERRLQNMLKMQLLDERHGVIEFELRQLMSKQESLKTAEDQIQESVLLDELMRVVESRANLVELNEAERLRHMNEVDAATNQLKETNLNCSDVTLNKKKTTMKTLVKEKKTKRDKSEKKKKKEKK